MLQLGHMNILGIETSCDETAASVVEDGTRLLSNVVASSAEMHVKTGGIIPEQAARQQIKSVLPVINEALTTSHQTPNTVDAIAVTVGPGLIGSLLVGVETAKTLSFLWKKPLIPVNHLVAHVYANWLNGASPKFPLVALVVSGGHTDLVYMKDHGKIKPFGTTRDDAAGECFDKCARLLGLPYPGGPSIAADAAKYLIQNTKRKLDLFPRPLIDQDNYDFSFSGLKTAVLREVASNKERPSAKLAAEIQEAIVDVLVAKTLRATKEYRPKSLLLGGGVAANSRLREKIESAPGLFIPRPKFCTDNAAVIASCAFYNYGPVPWQKISANPELTIAS